MGSVTIPSSGLVYLDANSVIYSVEKVNPYDSILAPLWAAAGPSSFVLTTSTLTLLEVLVVPLKTNNTLLEMNYRNILQRSSDVQLLSVTIPILERAAHLRAESGLKTPDAIHAATALEHGCALFVTNDASFRRVPGLPITILSDLLAP